MVNVGWLSSVAHYAQLLISFFFLKRAPFKCNRVTMTGASTPSLMSTKEWNGRMGFHLDYKWLNRVLLSSCASITQRIDCNGAPVVFIFKSCWWLAAPFSVNNGSLNPFVICSVLYTAERRVMLLLLPLYIDTLQDMTKARLILDRRRNDGHAQANSLFIPCQLKLLVNFACHFRLSISRPFSPKGGGKCRLSASRFSCHFLLFKFFKLCVCTFSLCVACVFGWQVVRF